MKFTERMQVILAKGITASKRLAHETGEKASELGTKGANKIESAQLKSRAEKLIARLGEDVYQALVDLNHATVSRETTAIREILGEIKALRARIATKEKEYKSIGAKAETKA